MIVAQWIIQRWLSGQLEALAGPGTQVNPFAALTAKRPEWVDGAVNAIAAAGRADNYFCVDRFHLRSTA